MFNAAGPAGAAVGAPDATELLQAQLVAIVGEPSNDGERRLIAVFEQHPAVVRKMGTLSGEEQAALKLSTLMAVGEEIATTWIGFAHAGVHLHDELPAVPLDLPHGLLTTDGVADPARTGGVLLIANGAYIPSRGSSPHIPFDDGGRSKAPSFRILSKVGGEIIQKAGLQAEAALGAEAMLPLVGGMAHMSTDAYPFVKHVKAAGDDERADAEAICKGASVGPVACWHVRYLRAWLRKFAALGFERAHVASFSPPSRHIRSVLAEAAEGIMPATHLTLPGGHGEAMHPEPVLSDSAPNCRTTGGWSIDTMGLLLMLPALSTLGVNVIEAPDTATGWRIAPDESKIALMKTSELRRAAEWQGWSDEAVDAALDDENPRVALEALLTSDDAPPHVGYCEAKIKKHSVFTDAEKSENMSESNRFTKVALAPQPLLSPRAPEPTSQATEPHTNPTAPHSQAKKPNATQAEIDAAEETRQKKIENDRFNKVALAPQPPEPQSPRAHESSH